MSEENGYQEAQAVGSFLKRYGKLILFGLGATAIAIVAAIIL